MTEEIQCDVIENKVTVVEGFCQYTFGFGRIRYPCPMFRSRECPLTESSVDKKRRGEVSKSEL